MSIPDNLRIASSHSSPFFLFSLYSESLKYWNLPFPANSTAEAVARIRHSVNSRDFDSAGIDDLSLYCVGKFSSVKASPGMFFKKPELVLSDLKSLIQEV